MFAIQARCAKNQKQFQSRREVDLKNIYRFLTVVSVAALLPVSTGAESAPRQADLPPRAVLDSLAMIYRAASDATLINLHGLATDETPVTDCMNQITTLLAGLAPAR